MPVPGTPNGGCNYHCSATDLSVHLPTKQEGPFGILHQKPRPLIAELKGEGGGANSVQYQRRMSQRDPKGTGMTAVQMTSSTPHCVDVGCAGVGV